MAFHVVYLDCRDIQRKRQARPQGRPDQQRTEQTGARGVRHRVKVVRGQRQRRQKRLDHGQQVAHMITRGQFGNDATKFSMHGLRPHAMPQQTLLCRVQGACRLIARRLQSQNQHKHLSLKYLNLLSGTSKILLREQIAASLPRSPLAYRFDMSRGFAAGLLALRPLVTVFRCALLCISERWSYNLAPNYFELTLNQLCSAQVDL